MAGRWGGRGREKGHVWLRGAGGCAVGPGLVLGGGVGRGGGGLLVASGLRCGDPDNGDGGVRRRRRRRRTEQPYGARRRRPCALRRGGCRRAGRWPISAGNAGSAATPTAATNPNRKLVLERPESKTFNRDFQVSGSFSAQF